MKQFSDDHDSSSNGSAGAFFTGLLAGAVIGAGLGLCFAPKAGAQLREDLSDSARDMGQRVSKTVNDLNDRGRDMLNRARDVVSTAGDQIGKVTAEAAQTLERGRRGANGAAAAERS